MKARKDREEEITGLDYFLPQEEMPTWKEENDVISLIEFFELWPTDEAALEWYENYRFRDGLFCPKCGGTNCYRVASGRPQPFRCRPCDYYFSAKVGTPMQNSNLPVRRFMLYIHLLLTDRKGESALKLKKSVGTAYHTSWFMGQRIRAMMEATEPIVLKGNLQVDESFLGGAFANMHEWKKERFGGDPYGNKIGVIGLVDEAGKFVAQKLETGDVDELLGFILEHAEQGSTIDSDGEPAYEQLPHFGYIHRSVNHTAKEYVGEDGQTTNRIEGIWGIMKRQYHGSHHWVSDKHAQRYIDELIERNNGGYGNGPVSIGAILDMAERRTMPYKKLTGKE